MHAALVLGDTRRSSKEFIPLTPTEPWLRIRSAGDLNKDRLLKELHVAAAEAFFSSPLKLEDIDVIATGLKRSTLESVARLPQSPERSASRRHLLETLGRSDLDWREAKTREVLEDAISYLRGKTLIIAAHHGENAGKHFVTISISGGLGHEVPVEVLGAAARSKAVNLLVYGCSTADSGLVGTIAPLRETVVVEALQRLYGSPIRTQRDMHARLAGDSTALAFDIRQAAFGRAEVVNGSDGGVVGMWLAIGMLSEREEDKAIFSRKIVNSDESRSHESSSSADSSSGIEDVSVPMGVVAKSNALLSSGEDASSEADVDEDAMLRSTKSVIDEPAPHGERNDPRLLVPLALGMVGVALITRHFRRLWRRRRQGEET